MPPKPKLKVDIEEFKKMDQVKEKLNRQLALIHQTEVVELPRLEKNLENIKGLFKVEENKNRRMIVRFSSITKIGYFLAMRIQ